MRNAGSGKCEKNESNDEEGRDSHEMYINGNTVTAPRLREERKEHGAEKLKPTFF